MANGRLVLMGGDAFVLWIRPDGREVGPLRVMRGGTCDGWSYDELVAHGEGEITLPKPAAGSRPEPPPEPSPKELAADAERAGRDMMRKFLVARGITR